MKEEKLVIRTSTKLMSISDFHTKTLKILKKLEVAQSSLQITYELFRQRNNTWADQYEHIITSIDEVNKPVLDFCQLLEDITNLPVAVFPLRYPLVLALHNADEQVRNLMPLVVISQTSSTRMVRKRQEIQRRFELLLQNCIDLLQEAQNLLDKIHFQERKIVNLV